MRFTLAPTVEELMDYLYASGWSAGDARVDDEWQVVAFKADQVVRKTGGSRYSAWQLAAKEARLLDQLLMPMN